MNAPVSEHDWTVIERSGRDMYVCARTGCDMEWQPGLMEPLSRCKARADALRQLQRPEDFA